MHEIDSPDFNKARGFLVGYSLAVFLLWFFGADLTKFSLMGNPIDLHRNTQHVWAVIVVINAYLWLRFLQRLPKRGLSFDEDMHTLLDECLISACKLFNKRRIFKAAQLQALEEEDGTLIRASFSGYLPYRHELEIHLEQKVGYGPTGPGSFGYPSRAKVVFNLVRTLERDGRTVTAHGGNGYEAIPGRILYRATIAYTFVKGAVGRSWFTDNVWPLIFGAITIGMALFRWLQINVPLWAS